MLGGILTRYVRDWIVWFVPLAATPFVFLLAVTGLGTLDALLFALFLLCLLSGRASKLYSVMFVLSLAMEIYGTWLGNWTWAEEAPWLGFTTVNPPLAAGAFYCMLDMLVVATVAARKPSTAIATGSIPIYAVHHRHELIENRSGPPLERPVRPSDRIPPPGTGAGRKRPTSTRPVAPVPVFRRRNPLC